ncbi:MAG: transcription-repair coupling factor (superfamily II helicase) [Parcubacteria group bacterium Gr01-1014_29]|nr:MAG: transcription-repair coupling factor (superfamily II helicase) [Parcubacteria group bacterium Gr01-1014_29]
MFLKKKHKNTALANEQYTVYTPNVRDAQKIEPLLIAGLHPHLLEKPVFWFQKQKKEILRARIITPFWRHATLVVEQGMAAKLSVFLRELQDLGYTKVQTVFHPGEYAHIGGEIRVYPINEPGTWRIDFAGNVIETVERLPDTTTAPVVSNQHKKLLERHRLGLLKNGDFVVHLDHGIGIFRGVLEKNGTSYIAIEYAPAPSSINRPDMLWVPEALAKKVAPYIGFRTPKIHRLGTPIWNAVKKRAREDIIKFARELLELYAKREVAERPAYEEDPLMEQELAASFVHEETPDQARAVADVLADMEKPRPMDRLLLADVGFGKTEVAVRAALRAVINGRQVAVLCPTTILADQHFETCTERLKQFPVMVERLSRLEKNAKQKQIIQRIAQGKTDIVIGTHRLLSKDISFANLGLLIIDEEQRFGVKQKEHIRKLKDGVDTVSLSATPIPRTLNFALSGLKPMSVITTPPKNRIAPKTFTLPFSKQVVKNALHAEIARGGQVYFLSNHIHKMPASREFIKKIAPQARVGILHGRMREEEILRTMREFREGKTHILLATTIIENGLDISNANTLIVQDASLIGLSQAHQLRGRIGRGETQSYAYFLYPPKRLTQKAERRLEALFRAQYLGAGQDLALRDMEIRGAGNILGRDQSGRLNQIGLNLYCQMLAEAVEQIRESSPLK